MITSTTEVNALRRLLLQIRGTAHGLRQELDELTPQVQDLELSYLRQTLIEIDTRSADLLVSIRATTPGH